MFKSQFFFEDFVGVFFFYCVLMLEGLEKSESTLRSFFFPEYLKSFLSFKSLLTLLEYFWVKYILGHSGSVYSGKWYIVRMCKVIHFGKVFLNKHFVFILLILKIFITVFVMFSSLKSPPNFTFSSVGMIFFYFIPKLHWLIFHPFYDLAISLLSYCISFFLSFSFFVLSFPPSFFLFFLRFFVPSFLSLFLSS